MDMPLSSAFLYLLTEEGNAESARNERSFRESDNSWPSDVLNIHHFCEIYPERGRFLSDLVLYLRERDAINFIPGSTEYKKVDLDLQKRYFACDLASLCISMTFSPVTKVSKTLNIHALEEDN